MHGAGSPQAQRIAMLGQADIEGKIAMANEVIYGTSDVPGLALPDVNTTTAPAVESD
jgi:hypothetical protein